MESILTRKRLTFRRARTFIDRIGIICTFGTRSHHTRFGVAHLNITIRTNTLRAFVHTNPIGNDYGTCIRTRDVFVCFTSGKHLTFGAHAFAFCKEHFVAFLTGVDVDIIIATIIAIHDRDFCTFLNTRQIAGCIIISGFCRTGLVAKERTVAHFAGIQRGVSTCFGFFTSRSVCVTRRAIRAHFVGCAKNTMDKIFIIIRTE